MDCFYCGWYDNNHAPNCPKKSTPEFQRGYEDGRYNKIVGFDPSKTDYNFGYSRGIIALENSENGYDPRES